jgi:hypothetical protein
MAEEGKSDQSSNLLATLIQFASNIMSKALRASSRLTGEPETEFKEAAAERLACTLLSVTIDQVPDGRNA